jgi:uncharacterized protein YndB with AHSA1/START domain
MSARPAAPKGDRVSVSVFVDAPPAIAFEVFTGEIDLWWRHGMKFRVGGRSPSVLHLEPRLGGRMFEAIASAPPQVIQTGTVTAWDPPHGLEIEWRGVNFGPHEKTTIQVRFEPRASGTSVTLVHSGFASLPADHPVRHGQAVDAFIRGMAMWWSDQMASLRMRVSDRGDAGSGDTPVP